MASDTTAENWAHLGKQLLEWRLRRGLSQETIYAETGVAEGTIARWEKGRNHSRTPTLYKLIKYYGWPEGALDRVLAGGTPEAEEVPAYPLTEDEVRAAVQALLHGEVTPRQAAMIQAALESQAHRTV